MAFLSSRFPVRVCQLNHGLLFCLFVFMCLDCLKQFDATLRKCSVNLSFVAFIVVVVSELLSVVLSRNLSIVSWRSFRVC